ncbi:Ig-like domain (group 2) [Mucilaginibacter sp. OK268]|uniref:LamG-like jellyroll fold domain-containing protein n=1 Tax=Mucilaginibacter sp. OK268 TaxID=1881048 RepID=UPI0008822530|nr:LamG-like jellyroll fold domain-containing protein [Mucilaginibacter sp. OK268]SDP95020.1 Ig-like domain (group 2) [Mucilaginibacter sp. OK268]
MKKNLLLLCAVMALFTACKKSYFPPVDTLKAISLGKDTTISVGQTIQLNITTTPADYNKALLRLSSSDTTVLTVKNDGQVTAKKTGTAVITATNQLKTISATCHISVIATTDPLTGILFTDTLSMEAGDVVQLHYTTTPPNYDPSLLVWKSSDTTVVSVSSTGTVTAKTEGVSTVTLTNKAKSFSLSGIVQVTDKLKIGLLAFYPFNNNTNDLSGHGNTGVANSISSIADRFGKPNSAYYFNGTSSYILVKDKAELRLANTDFTINNWVKLDSYDPSYGTQIICKRGPGSDNGWSSSITGSDFQNSGQGGLGLVSFGKGDISALSTKAIDLNKWYMITTVYKTNVQQISFYVNGAFVNTVYGVSGPNAFVTADLYMGKDNPQVPSTGYFLKGALDDVRIYGRALHATEIKKLYNLTH